MTPASLWPKRLAAAALIWGQGVMLFGTLRDPSPRNKTLLVSVALSGLYTLVLYITRRRWLPRLQDHPRRSAALLGIFNALFIEALFWAVEKMFGASGVAAHPNLLLDWLITMPWYIGLVLLFTRQQARWRFSAPALLFLCGVYEWGADGFLGGVFMPLLTGARFNPGAYIATMLLLVFWQFIPTYSSLILPPAWVLDALPASGAPAPGPRRLMGALRPLLWVLPYAAWLVGALLVIGKT